MLGFVQNWFAPRANPIGVDFGSDCLRLAQVQFSGTEHRLIAAASADVPGHVRHDPAARLAFFVETTRDLLAQGSFRGRQAILSLPASLMYIQHLRVPRMDEDAIKKALPWEARGKLPIDPSHALLRHLVAGEVYHDTDPKLELIVMAAGRELVEQLLAAAAKARLDVVGMNVEPKAVIDCFSHVYRRKTDQDVTNCFIDIGCCATRAVIARGRQVLFARSIPIGGDHLNRATAAALKISFEEAKMLRIQLCAQQPTLDEHRERQAVRASAEPQPAAAPQTASAEQATGAADNTFALLGAAIARSERRSQSAGSSDLPVDASSAERAVRANATETQQARAVEQACREPLNKLVEELDLCRRYYEATFPNRPVERLIFIGGESRHRPLCQHVARELGVAAQVGDPMVRMGRISEIGIESGIDRRQPQPGWAVAIGLSMGPAGATSPAGATAEAKA